MRKKIIAGNWKMNLNLSAAKALAEGTKAGIQGKSLNCEVQVFPSNVHLPLVASIFAGTEVLVGAQNSYPSQLTAMTGEISPDQLEDFGIKLILVGHSERRQFLGETNSSCNSKLKFFLSKSIRTVYCIGETLAERESGKTFEVLAKQINEGLEGIGSELYKDLVIAYEPVWAIGTGKVATPEEAEEAHAFVRKTVSNLKTGGESVAIALRILYGGSVKPDNIASLLSKPNIDGGLVGGASQATDSFLKLIFAEFK